MPLAADHFSLSSLPLTAAVTGFVKKASIFFQDNAITIRLSIDLTDKGFPLLLHSSIIVKTHNLLELLKREAV